MNEMYEIGSPASNQWTSNAWLRAFRVTSCALGLFFVLTAIPALAAEDNDEDADDASFEQKIVRNLMSGLGAIDPNSSNGIDYRERSPLVVPPQLNLPPPETNRASAPNWPTDPEVIERKKRKEARRNQKTSTLGRDEVLLPSELNAVGRAKAQASTTPERPGLSPYQDNLTPSQLGSKGLFSMFGSSKSSETVPFTGEPPRESLTQPPSGYQTPSPSYAYGVTPEVKGAPMQEDKLMPSQLR